MQTFLNLSSYYIYRSIFVYLNIDLIYFAMHQLSKPPKWKDVNWTETDRQNLSLVVGTI